MLKGGICICKLLLLTLSMKSKDLSLLVKQVDIRIKTIKQIHQRDSKSIRPNQLGLTSVYVLDIQINAYLISIL